MATNKNAILRYKILDKCFRNTGRRYFIQDLIDECNKALVEINPETKGISRRQIFDDITFMESEDGWGVELLKPKVGRRSYYRYEDPSFSINNMPLNELEIKQLQTAVGILSQFKGMPHFEWMQELSLKLNHGIASEQDENVIIEFDSNQYLKGIEHLGTLHNAIYYKKVLKISYQPYENDSPITFIIHPYYLKQYNNRWFLFGYNPELSRYDWNLALDRIIVIEEVAGTYNLNTEIDWREYFQDMIGVTKPYDAECEIVVLHFKGKAGKYVESKPLHDSQNDKWLEPGLLRVKLDVVINFELKRLILSYGPDVEVISPGSLRDEITQNLKEAYEQY